MQSMFSVKFIVFLKTFLHHQSICHLNLANELSGMIYDIVWFVFGTKSDWNEIWLLIR